MHGSMFAMTVVSQVTLMMIEITLHRWLTNLKMLQQLTNTRCDTFQVLFSLFILLISSWGLDLSLYLESFSFGPDKLNFKVCSLAVGLSKNQFIWLTFRRSKIQLRSMPLSCYKCRQSDYRSPGQTFPGMLSDFQHHLSGTHCHKQFWSVTLCLFLNLDLKRFYSLRLSLNTYPTCCHRFWSYDRMALYKFDCYYYYSRVSCLWLSSRIWYWSKGSDAVWLVDNCSLTVRWLKSKISSSSAARMSI